MMRDLFTEPLWTHWRRGYEPAADKPLYNVLLDSVFHIERTEKAGMRLSAIIFGLGCLLAQSAHGAEQCGPLNNGYGPYDYRVDKAHLPVVENNHFAPGVEKLIAGQNGTIGSDIDYTLRAFPNHPRALMAMAKFGRKMKNDRVIGATYPIPCYFERAVRFRPDDGVVRILYADFLMKRGETTEALTQVQAAEQLAGQSADMHYNIGLAYLELKDYPKSLEHAHTAYRLGFPLPGLRNRLERAGKWAADTKLSVPQQASASPSESTQQSAASKPQ
jgi:uncharacterized protein (TIGR02996 family)